MLSDEDRLEARCDMSLSLLPLCWAYQYNSKKAYCEYRYVVNKFAIDSSFLHVKKTGQEQYSLFFQSIGALLSLYVIGSLLFSSVFAFAQFSNVAAGNLQKMANGTNTSAAAANNSSTPQPSSTGSQGPVTVKISDKGIYKVQLTFISPSPIQSPSILPKKGFQMEIDFLNASAPPPATQTIPQKESAIRGESSVGMPGTQPSIIQRLVPIDSFDMTIYSNSGKVLWNKTNQAVTSGRAIETISFTNSSYSGDITILIDNIKASNTMAGGNPMTPLSTPVPKGTPDSVKFTATLA